MPNPQDGSDPLVATLSGRVNALACFEVLRESEIPSGLSATTLLEKLRHS